MTESKTGPVHLRDWGGPGAPIILLHGMAANTHWWDAVAPLWQGKLRAAALDFRGHGDSDWAPDGAYSADLWLEDVETARKALGWDRFILCGHSMGARMALNYAERYPDRLRGVAAVDFLPEIRANRPNRFKRASGRSQPVYPTQEAVVSRFRLEPGGTSLEPAQVRALGLECVRPRGDGWSWKFDWRCLSLPIVPVWPQLAAIRTPALVVRGGLSAIIGPEDFTRVAADVRAAAVTIPGAHHHVPLDKPVELAKAVADFATSLPAVIARVAALFRYPVKSMQGAELPRADVGPAGIPGDRGWALRERATGRPASAKRYAVLMLCMARFLDEAAAGAPPPPAEVELPDGTRTRTDDSRAGALLSRLLGAEVAFVRADDGAGHFDARPLHFLTTAALATMRAKSGLDFDVRRFRPNVLVALDAPGRPEDAWPGTTLRVGAVRVRILKPVQRCVMTTLPQRDLPKAAGVYQAVFADGGALGVYGEALAAGSWRAGDAVEAAA